MVLDRVAKFCNVWPVKKDGTLFFSSILSWTFNKSDSLSC